MLTQIEIDGFKTFKDFKVELAPFQVIVGPNGSGKSNLFDALHLLSRLAEVDDLRLAFQAPHDDPQKLRGDAHELFTVLPNGQHTNRIRMAVEMLVDRKVQDDWGEEAELKYTRLRYELEITLRSDEHGMEQLYVTYESLRSISEDEDNWSKRYGLSSQNNWLPSFTDERVYFISTTQRTSRSTVAEAAIPYDSSKPSTASTAIATINLHQDGERTDKFYQADKVKRTVLSSINDTEFPHAFAAREEMRSWRFLHLNPEVLRQSSSVNAPSFLAEDGSNLPIMLARMQIEDRFALNHVSRDLANLVPDLINIELKKDEIRNEYTIWATYQDGSSLSSRVLSDGTLRLLAIVTLKNDLQFHGVLCFEEPENGIHPSYLMDIAHLLRGLATDFADLQQADEPLRQVLVTTHSPTFISQPDVIDALLFTYTMTLVEPLATSVPPMRITQAAPVLVLSTQSQSANVSSKDIDKEEVSYTIDQVRELLANNNLNEALDRLDKSLNKIDER